METFGSNLKDLLEHTSWQAELDDTDEAAQLQQENKIRTKVKGLRGLSDQNLWKPACFRSLFSLATAVVTESWY